MRRIILLCFFLLSFATSAQENPEVISAANISRLQSVAQIDFAQVLSFTGEGEAGFEVDLSQQDTGWFYFNETGEIVAIPTSQDGNVYFILDSLPFYYESSPYSSDSLRSVHVQINQDNLATVYSSGESLQVRIGTMGFLGGGLWEFEISLQDEVLDSWFDCNSDWYADCNLYLEMISLDNASENYIYYIPAQNLAQAPIRLPYAPAQDPEAVVRIGRIPPPYTVTSSLEGIVKLWNLQTGETLYEVDNGTGLPSVFGAINNPPTQLVWRDNANEALYLLNFETGENRHIADLNGEYAQWYFLSPDASVILGIDLGFNQRIVAWDVATGTRIDLGPYRHCNRPQPDMVRLSSDGTSLVIGCDTGLDIWRIVN